MQFFVAAWKPPPLPPQIIDKSPSPRKIYEFYLEDRNRWQESLIAYLHQLTVVINSGTQGFGPDLVAANTIVLEAYQHVVTGIGTIQFVRTVPNLPASHITLISADGFTLATGGNISFPKTVKANQAVMLIWNPVTMFWYPIVSVEDLGDVPDAPGRFTVVEVDVNRRAIIDFTQPGHIGQVLPQLFDYTALWQALHAYTISTYITDSNGNIQELRTAGTSGAAPPTWSVVLDGLTSDGTAVWMNVGGSGAASIILHSPKYLEVDVHQATPAEIRFTTAAGVVVSKITKGATAATDLSLIPATTATGTLALGDANTWNHIKLLAATDILLQAVTAQIVATTIQLQATTIQLQATTNQIQGVVELTDTVTKYKNIVTVSNGVPSEYATVDLTGQTAAIAATTIYAVPAAGQGMYRISYVATVTTVATVSSILGGANGFQVVFTNADGSVVVTTPVGATSNLNTTQAYLSGSLIVYAKASTNIQYSFGYTSVNAAEMVFALHIKVEAL